MFKSVVEVIKSNKEQIIKKGLVVVGSAAGFALVSGLIKMGLPCDLDEEYDYEDIEVDINDIEGYNEEEIDETEEEA